METVERGKYTKKKKKKIKNKKIGNDHQHEIPEYQESVKVKAKRKVK